MNTTNTRLKLGVIGAGSVVREIYQHFYFRSEYSPMLEICAVANRGAEARNWFGGLAGLPRERRFSNYQQMLERVELDAVQINTPDHLHCEATLAAFKKGLDVLLPKPLATSVREAEKMIAAAKKAGRLLLVDFHKREDPRIKEAAARFQSGRYGTFQTAVFYMLDKLSVADPNHRPRFFASPNFAAKNSPVSFLTVHMADALMHIVKLKPASVRATGYSQKLPSLKPVSVKGYDLVDTEIMFETGAIGHIITGWALPNTAWSTTVQSGRLICSGGMLDLALDAPGMHEIHHDGSTQVNPLFRNFEANGQVSGYGISSPGRLLQQMLAWRNAASSSRKMKAAALDPMVNGYYATVVLEAAEQSLSKGRKMRGGTTLGVLVATP